MKLVKGNSLHSISDEELMLGVQEGDERSFEALYDRYSKKLVWYFYKMLGQCQETAEDAVQDLFVKIIEKPKLFDPKRKFSTWIFSVAHNKCKNEYRKIAVRNEYAERNQVLDIQEETVGQKFDHALFREDLLNELDNLEEVQRSAFLLRNKYDFSIKEIAEITESSEGTVKSRLFYTTKKLSEKLEIYNPNK